MVAELTVDTATGFAFADEAVRDVRQSINQAREHRKRLEPLWHQNLAFAAGKHYLEWNRDQRRLAFPERLEGQDLYTADVITEYRTTALGELGGDDDRPELLLRRDDQASEDYQAQLNRAVSWGWDYEWKGDQALEEARRICVDTGTAAIRVRWDGTVGPVKYENVPHLNGQPILDLEQATQQVAAAAERGETLEFKDVRRGAIRWDVLSPFNLIVPPGVPNEQEFPWECVVRPALLSRVRAEFGDIAAELDEDGDIGSMLGLDLNGELGDGGTFTLGAAGDPKTGRLKGHVWLFTYYERPCPDYPEGRTLTFAGNALKTLRVTDQLPKVGPDGEYRSGISYLHWWRVSGRFWSRGLVDVMKDIQRSFNKRRNQTHQIIDRGMPLIFVERNSRALERQGLIAEVVELDPAERDPKPFTGFGPGDWMWRDIEAMREDLEHATGLRGPRLGDNPPNVNTYGQLSILNENEQVKRQQIVQQHKLAIAHLVEDSVHDIRTYWGPDRQIDFPGDEDMVESHTFNATDTPAFYIVKVPKGAARPRSQAAELTKVEQIFQAAQATGATLANPQAWVQWLKESLEAGQALELPAVLSDSHVEKAELENHAMWQGVEMPVAYYDPIEVHLPVHREAQIEAEMAENVQVVQVLEQHVQEHIAMAARMATLGEPGEEQPPAGAPA